MEERQIMHKNSVEEVSTNGVTKGRRPLLAANVKMDMSFDSYGRVHSRIEFQVPNSNAK